MLAILDTSQQVIPLRFKKRSERYLSYGEQVEIHFVRTGLESGISNHDDDYTPTFSRTMYSFQLVGLMSVKPNFSTSLEKRSAPAESSKIKT